MYPLLAINLLVTLTPTAPIPKVVRKDDKSALVGSWTATAMTVNGSDAESLIRKFAFDADGKLEWVTKHNNSIWVVILDTTATPRTMKLVYPGRENNNDWDCVYELNGDTLKLGWLRRGMTPPAKLEPSEGVTLYEMTRDTSSK